MRSVAAASSTERRRVVQRVSGTASTFAGYRPYASGVSRTAVGRGGSRARRRAYAPVGLVGQHGAPLVAAERAAGDPAGEPLQRRAVDGPLARRARPGEEQAAVGLEG